MYLVFKVRKEIIKKILATWIPAKSSTKRIGQKNTNVRTLDEGTKSVLIADAALTRDFCP